MATEYYQALTVNINPESYILPLGSNSKHKYKNIPVENQTAFLDYHILSKLDGTHLYQYIYSFELTAAGNTHLHVQIPCTCQDDVSIVQGLKSQFIAQLPKMPAYLQERVWMQKPVYDKEGWEHYVLKERCLDIDEPIPLSERIIIPKVKLFK